MQALRHLFNRTLGSCITAYSPASLSTKPSPSLQRLRRPSRPVHRAQDGKAADTRARSSGVRAKPSLPPTFRAFTGTGLAPTRYVEVRRRFLREHPGHALDGWPLPAD